MILPAVKGFGTPKGIHGEMPILDSLSDSEVRDAVKARLAQEKIYVNAINIRIVRFAPGKVAFEVM